MRILGNNKRITGIYIIQNKITKKIYVGQSVNIKRRWGDHKSQLKNNKHHNDYLQRSWNVHSEDEFDFIILEECKKHELDEKEEAYVSKYQSNNYKYGYNSTPGGANNTISDSTVEKLRTSTKTKPVLQFDLNGNFVKRWISVSEVGRVLGANPTNVSGCCHFKYGRKTTLGSIWIHEDYYLENGLNLDYYLEDVPTTWKPVVQISLQNVVIAEFPSAREASRQTGFSWKNISQVCNGDKKTHKGYKWAFT